MWFLPCGDDDDDDEGDEGDDGDADNHLVTGTKAREERSIAESSTVHFASHGYLVSTVAVRTSFLLTGRLETSLWLVVIRARPPFTKSAGVGIAV